MVYWNQLEGNNIVVSGSDLSGNPRFPTYNGKLGFSNGCYFFVILRFLKLTTVFRITNRHIPFSWDGEPDRNLLSSHTVAYFKKCSYDNFFEPIYGYIFGLGVHNVESRTCLTTDDLNQTSAG